MKVTRKDQKSRGKKGRDSHDLVVTKRENGNPTGGRGGGSGTRRATSNFVKCKFVVLERKKPCGTEDEPSRKRKVRK